MSDAPSDLPFGPSDEGSGEIPLIQVADMLRNTVAMLQANPERYSAFGVYWWPVKALLKRAGYGPENLMMLGDYEDPETAAMAPATGLQETLAAAIETYGYNVAYPHTEGKVEAPDGSLITIYDVDAGR